MTIDEFMKRHNLNKKTVTSWISQGFIPGAELSNDFVPDSARIPYTKARAKTADSIYCSIIKGTRKLFHVLPQIYKICPEEFNTYIEQLEQAGLIVRRITDGITYYDSTLKSTKYNRTEILNAIGEIIGKITEGVTSAITEKSKSA